MLSCKLTLNNDNERSQARATSTLLCPGWKTLLDSTVDSKIIPSKTSIQDQFTGFYKQLVLSVRSFMRDRGFEGKGLRLELRTVLAGSCSFEHSSISNRYPRVYVSDQAPDSIVDLLLYLLTLARSHLRIFITRRIRGVGRRRGVV